MSQPEEENKKRRLLTPPEIKAEWDKIYHDRQKRMFPDNLMRKKKKQQEESRVITF